jgi:uncharacterized protein (DUF488 family)
MSRLPAIYTIGHSTRTLQDLIKLLQNFAIQLLLDVRTVPRSRHVPHFNSEILAAALDQEGIEYRSFKHLGGLRKPLPDSPNAGWRNASFRGFADYMQSDAFWSAIAEVVRCAAEKRVVLMCAEAVPWRCHRSLVADALVVVGHEVRHIISAKELRVHELTPFASVQGKRITYPIPGTML